MYFEIKYDFKPEEVIDYLRKSRSDDPTLTVEEVLKKHEELLDEWAINNLGGVVPEENKFRERIVSAEKLDERPEIQKVLRLIESPKYKAIKCADPQRLSRGDLEDVGRLMKLLKLTNTVVITLKRIYNLRYERDWKAFERELKKGNKYLEYTKKILNRGRLLSVSQGNYIGKNPPYGFDKTKIVVDKKKCPTLKENKEQADVVRMIFDMYVNQDMGATSICYKLDELGIKPPKGEKWSPYSIRHMLSNVHYIGLVRWNYRKTTYIVEEGEIIKTRPIQKDGECVTYNGRHDGIISEELFNAAQQKKGRNSRAKAKTKVRNPFASLLFCQCGRAMSFRTYKDKDGNEKSEPRLLCDNQAHCGTSSCTYNELADKMCDFLQNCIEDFEVSLQNDEGDSIKLHANLIKNLEQKMKDLQAKELAQWEAQASPNPADRMPQEIFRQLNERLLKEKEETQQALSNALASMPDPVDYEEKIVKFSNALSSLTNPNVSAKEKNNLLKGCIERIEYKREKATIQTGIKGKDNGLKVGANWTKPPIELDVMLKV